MLLKKCGDYFLHKTLMIVMHKKNNQNLTSDSTLLTGIKKSGFYLHFG